jgi:hypothetical protein
MATTRSVRSSALASIFASATQYPRCSSRIVLVFVFR